MPIKMFFKGYISGVFVFVCFIYLSFKKKTDYERAVNYYSQYINELFVVRWRGIEPLKLPFISFAWRISFAKRLQI